MIVLENSDMKSDTSSKDEMPPLKNYFNVEVGDPMHGDLLMKRKYLCMQPKEDDDEEQFKHIFHIKCHMKDKVCIMINDNDIFTNVASILLMEKLNLQMHKHPKLYRL